MGTVSALQCYDRSSTFMDRCKGTDYRRMWLSRIDRNREAQEPQVCSPRHSRSSFAAKYKTMQDFFFSGLIGGLFFSIVLVYALIVDQLPDPGWIHSLLLQRFRRALDRHCLVLAADTARTLSVPALYRIHHVHGSCDGQ